MGKEEDNKIPEYDPMRIGPQTDDIPNRSDYEKLEDDLRKRHRLLFELENERKAKEIQQISEILTGNFLFDTKRLVRSVIIAVLALALALASSNFLISKSFKKEPPVVTIEAYEKDKILSKVILLSTKSKSYEDYKFLFETSFDCHFPKVHILNNDDLLYYVDKPSLSQILKDSKIDLITSLSDSVYFDSNTVVDKAILISNIQMIISENESRNPFDGLSDEQRYWLENLMEKLKSSGNYNTADLLKIAQEFKSQNKTINKYLDKSEQSFELSDKAYKITNNAMIISIIALILTAVQFSVWIWSFIVFIVKIIKGGISVMKAKKKLEEANQEETKAEEA